MLLGVVPVEVDAEHEGDVGIGRRSGDDDLLRARVDVLLAACAVSEEAGGLDRDVDFEVTPRQVRGILLRQHPQLVLADLDRGVADLDVLAERPQCGVVPQQMRHRLQVAEVVRRHDLEVAAALEERAEEVPPDPPEAVDPHTRLGHAASVWTRSGTP